MAYRIILNHLVPAFLVIAAALALAGCYETHAAYEEARLLCNRTPISTVLEKDDLSPDVKGKLETVLSVREYAQHQLDLNVGGAYTSVARVDDGAIVYVVMAAPRDSLKPYTWWYPIVGSVPYRGYFKEKNAIAEAHAMEKRGYDTMVRPAVAFSSLGFFDDPLLTNLLELDRVELAGVLIHEMFHRTYYLAGDAMFNESAANWVGCVGAIGFFSAREGQSSSAAAEARSILESNLEFGDFLFTEQARLLRIYDNQNLTRAEKLKQRKVAFAAIKADYLALEPKLSGIEKFDLDKEPLNNAVLVNYLLYFHDLRNFATLDQMNHGDTQATIAQIISIAKANPDDPFYAIWQRTRGPSLARK